MRQFVHKYPPKYSIRRNFSHHRALTRKFNRNTNPFSNQNIYTSSYYLQVTNFKMKFSSSIIFFGLTSLALSLPLEYATSGSNSIIRREENGADDGYYLIKRGEESTDDGYYLIKRGEDSADDGYYLIKRGDNSADDGYYLIKRGEDSTDDGYYLI
jgi:hypothetical protein